MPRGSASSWSCRRGTPLVLLSLLWLCMNKLCPEAAHPRGPAERKRIRSLLLLFVLLPFILRCALRQCILVVLLKAHITIIIIHYPQYSSSCEGLLAVRDFYNVFFHSDLLAVRLAGDPCLMLMGSRFESTCKEPSGQPSM